MSGYRVGEPGRSVFTCAGKQADGATCGHALFHREPHPDGGATITCAKCGCIERLVPARAVKS